MCKGNPKRERVVRTPRAKIYPGQAFQKPGLQPVDSCVEKGGALGLATVTYDVQRDITEATPVKHAYSFAHSRT